MTNEYFTGLINVGILDPFENFLAKEGKNNSKHDRKYLNKML